MKADMDFRAVVIGTGCAGFRAAERLWECGIRDAVLLTEGIGLGTSRNTGSDKQTYYKLTLCGGEGDSVREMAQTLFSGGAVNGDIALAEAAGSVRGFMHLADLGVPFTANEYGEYVGYKTDHDPRQRATSCGPLTSKLMTEALERSVKEKNIRILDGLRVVRLLTEENRLRGLVCLDREGKTVTVACPFAVLATGGPAGIYENVVYPESQHGSTGLAVEAGALCANLDQWQYGIASTKFRWNLSGTYQQVLPRYLSVTPSGEAREFLPDALGGTAEALDMVFLKGYQWPFDVRKLGARGSSRVDIAVFNELEKGNRVFMDFTREPAGLDAGFEGSGLCEEARTYLERSGALLPTPIARLEKMNPRAIDLYASHGIDLHSEWLEISVCAQHCNGGVDVDADWQSSVNGLYVAGEAAGTFGLHRPGGSALNSTQVGAMRAAEHIARRLNGGEERECEERELPDAGLPVVRYDGPGESVSAVLRRLRRRMSSCAAFLRDTEKMKELLGELDDLCADLPAAVRVSPDPASPDGLPAFYLLRDTVLTQRAVLSAMLFSASARGSHGSALIDAVLPGGDDADGSYMTVTVTGAPPARPVSRARPVRPVPDAELWFEKVFNRRA